MVFWGADTPRMSVYDGELLFSMKSKSVYPYPWHSKNWLWHSFQDWLWSLISLGIVLFFGGRRVIWNDNVSWMVRCRG